MFHGAGALGLELDLGSNWIRGLSWNRAGAGSGAAIGELLQLLLLLPVVVVVVVLLLLLLQTWSVWRITTNRWAVGFGALKPNPGRRSSGNT